VRLCVDASVAVKWFLAGVPGEDDTEVALLLLDALVAGEHTLQAPPHFVAEVAAVLARVKPRDAVADVADLLEIPREEQAAPAIHLRAVELAIRHGQHVFDTLYHAVALETPETVLVTADQRYFDRAHREGAIVMLSAFAT
jgi:predicted nucleic acid-binding protein